MDSEPESEREVTRVPTDVKAAKVGLGRRRFAYFFMLIAGFNS